MRGPAGRRQYVMVGSGAAGFAAAEAIRTYDPRGSIVLLSEEAEGFYSRPGLAYHLTGELGEEQLFPFRPGEFEQLEITRVTGRAARVHAAGHQVELHNGQRLRYDRLLIATGSTAVRLRVPGAQADGVVKLDNLEDARGILRRARRGRRALVVGGGITALELAEGLAARGMKVTYLLRGDRYWSNVLDEVESRIIESRLKEQGVQISFHTELDEILVERGRVVGARTKDGRRLACDLVAAAIGVTPRLELAVASDITTDRGIVVDDTLESCVADVFAAGDVAQVYDPLTGQMVLDTLWGPARDQGRIAGMNMAGIVTRFVKPVAFNVTRLAHLTTTIIGMVNRGGDADLAGIARGDSEVWRQLPDAIAAQSGFDVNHLRLLVGQKTLLGAVVMGDQTLSRPIHQLIEARADITPLREQLLHPEAPVAGLIAGFWEAWRQAHGAQ